MTTDMWWANLPTLSLFVCAAVLAVVMGRRPRRGPPRERRTSRRTRPDDTDGGT